MADETYTPVQIALTAVLRRQQMMVSVKAIHRTYKAADVLAIVGGGAVGLVFGFALSPVLGLWFIGVGVGLGSLGGMALLTWRPLPGEHAGRAIQVIGMARFRKAGIPQMIVRGKSLPLYLGIAPAPRVAAGNVILKRSTIEIPTASLPRSMKRRLLLPDQ